jgi:hypothetical protein
MISRYIIFLIVFASAQIFSNEKENNIALEYVKLKNNQDKCSHASDLFLKVQGNNVSEFRNFVTEYFGQIFDGQKLLSCIERINFLMNSYQSRLAKNFDDYEFTQDEYNFFEKVLQDFFGVTIDFVNEKDSNEELYQLAIKFKVSYEKAYEKVFGTKIIEWTKNQLADCDNDSLVFYFNEKLALPSNREFFSDVHSSPLYFSRFFKMLNREKNESFNPVVMTGDLSDRPLLPLFKKNELARFFDLLLNQIHLLNGLYVHYCLKNNKKENIFFVATLGNHEELNVNLRNDKRIYDSYCDEKLQAYFLWNVNALTHVIPVQIVFVDEIRDQEIIITSLSHAVGKQHFDAINSQIFYEKKDQGFFCYKVNLKKSRQSALKEVDRDFNGFRDFLKKNQYFHEEYYVRAYFDFLELTGNNLTSHILTRMDPFASSCKKTGKLWTGKLCADLKDQEVCSEEAQKHALNILEKQREGKLFVKFEDSRGFKIDELHYMFTLFKYIEIENLKVMLPVVETANKKVCYHSCCGHQHDEDTLKNGFCVNFKTGKIYLSSYYYNVTERDRLHFSMCATCMNKYYLNFKKYVDSFKAQYPELFSLLEVDFNISNSFEDIHVLGSKNFLLGALELKDHNEVLLFLSEKMKTNDSRIKEAIVLYKNKNVEKLSDNDKILHQKMKEFFDKI